jgi:hypothetical protein
LAALICGAVVGVVAPSSFLPTKHTVEMSPLVAKADTVDTAGRVRLITLFGHLRHQISCERLSYRQHTDCRYLHSLL